MIQGIIQTAVAIFELPVTVSDYTYSTVDRADTSSLSETRTVYGAVDPSRSKNMERIFGGSISDGDIMIITEDTLYIDDEYSTGTRKQSFVAYRGLNYRASQLGDWTALAGVKAYLCKRHFGQLPESESS